MCQHGHLDTSILAYLGSRGLLTHFEGNGGIFKAKQAIHGVPFATYPFAARKRSGWIDSGMTCIFLLQQNWAKMMDRWMLFLFCKIHGDLFHSVSFLALEPMDFSHFKRSHWLHNFTQHSNGKNWRPWGSKHGIQPWPCAVASHAYAWSQAHWSE